MSAMNYDRLAAEYAPNRTAHPEIMGRLAAHCVARPPDRILDVGSGSGNYLAALRAVTGASCVGLDPSRAMLEEASRRAPGALLVQGRGEKLPFAATTFALIISIDVIHHMTGPAAYFREAYRTLRPGGCICTVTDSEWMIRRRVPLAEYFPGTVQPEVARYPAVDALRLWMEQAGFLVEKEEAVEWRYDLTDLQPFRDKAFSSLHLISEEEYQAGLARMGRDLEHGPIASVWRNAVLWGKKQPPA